MEEPPTAHLRLAGCSRRVARIVSRPLCASDPGG
jgi:hypothetical protein